MDAVLTFINKMTTIRSGFVLELIICEILFSIGAKPRKWWRIPTFVTVITGIVGFYFVGRFFPNIPVPTLTGLTTFFLSVLVQWAILDIPFSRVLFNCVGAYAVQNLGINVREAFLYAVTLTGWSKAFVRIGITLAVYVICYFVFARARINKELNVSNPILMIVTFVTLIIANVLTVVVSKTGQSSGVTKLVLAICCLLALALQYEVFNRGVIMREAEVMEQLLYQEQKHHELSQETVDIINIKCHDLKKQIELFKAAYGSDARRMINDVENAVMIYGDIVKTGNKNLDLVITEQKLYCEKHGISIDVMADGGLIDFMTAYDIYSLFGNALKNAIENAVDEEEGKRSIELSVFEKGEYICVKITNYCSKKLEFEKGLPITNKDDKRFHGYGVKSMEYIVKKYKGNMAIELKDGIFKVKALFKKTDNR